MNANNNVGSNVAADERKNNGVQSNALGASAGRDGTATGAENGAAVEMPASSQVKPKSNPSDGGSAIGPLFSVGDVAAITQFAARGLYRNFALYRMCFLQKAKHCKESRVLQVQTPLALEPLQNAELVAQAATSG